MKHSRTKRNNALFLAPALGAMLIAVGCGLTEGSEPQETAQINDAPLATQEETDAYADDAIDEANADQVYSDLRSSIEADLQAMNE